MNVSSLALPPIECYSAVSQFQDSDVTVHICEVKKGSYRLLRHCPRSALGRSESYREVKKGSYRLLRHLRSWARSRAISQPPICKSVVGESEHLHVYLTQSPNPRLASRWLVKASTYCVSRVRRWSYMQRERRVVSIRFYPKNVHQPSLK